MTSAMRVETETARRTRESLAERIDESGDLEGLCRPLLEILHKISGMDSVYLTQIDPEQSEQRIRFSYNQDGLTIAEGLKVPWEDTLCRRALKDNIRIETDVPRRWPDADIARRLGIQTYINVPVTLDNGDIVGTLCGVSATSQPVPEHVLDLMAVFAQLFARQIEREQAATAAHTRADAAELTSALFAALVDIGRICSQSPTLDEALAGCANSLSLRYPQATVVAVSAEALFQPSRDDGPPPSRNLLPWVRSLYASGALPDGAGWWQCHQSEWQEHQLDTIADAQTRAAGIACAVFDDKIYGALIVRTPVMHPLEYAIMETLNDIALQLSLMATREQLNANLRASHAELERQSHSDPLTGLANRRYFDKESRRFEASVRRRGDRLCVAFIDLDHFKALNDRYGHHIGDLFIIEFARRLSAATRRDELCCRHGGDEFLVLARVERPGDIEPMHRRLANVLCGAFELNGITIDYAGPSIGIAVQNDADETTAELIARADALMYAHKQARRTDTAPARRQANHF